MSQEFEVGKLHHGLTYQQYHDAEGFRSSWLHHLNRSPAHFIAKKDKDDPTPAKEFGKIFHYALENGERFMDVVKVEPVFTGYTKKGEPTSNPNATDVRDKRAAWLAGLPKGALVVTADDHRNLTGMLRAMGEHKVVRNIIKDGVRETSGFVRCPETGLILKFRPDLITKRGHMADYKSTRDARYWQFYYEIFSNRPNKRFYILSAAHYAYCAKLMGLEQHDKLTYIAVEKETPHGINVFPLDSGCLDVGEQVRAKLMRMYAKCKEEDKWPAYDERVKPVSPPEFPVDAGGDIDDAMDEDEENN